MADTRRFPDMESCSPLEEGETRALIYRDDTGRLMLYVNGKRVLCLSINIDANCSGSDVRVTLPGEFVKYCSWPDLPPSDHIEQK